MADAAPPVEAPKAKKKPNRLVVEEATNDDNSVRNKLPTSRAFLTLLVDLAQLLQQSRDDERVSLCKNEGWRRTMGTEAAKGVMVSHLNDAVVGPEMSARHSAVVAQQHETFLDIMRRTRTRFTIPCHAAQLALQATPRVSTETGALPGSGRPTLCWSFATRSQSSVPSQKSCSTSLPPRAPRFDSGGRPKG